MNKLFTQPNIRVIIVALLASAALVGCSSAGSKEVTSTTAVPSSALTVDPQSGSFNFNASGVEFILKDLEGNDHTWEISKEELQKYYTNKTNEITL